MNKKILFILFLMFAFITNPLAVCTNQELINLANEVQVHMIEDRDVPIKMTTADGKTYDSVWEKEYTYVLAFTPYDDRIQLEVHDIDTDEEYPVEYSKKYETVVVGSDIHFEPRNYAIAIYSNLEDTCKNDVLRIIRHTVNGFNNYSSSEFCQNHKDADICAIDADVSNMSEEELEEAQNKVIQEEMSISEKILLYIKSYWYFVIIPFAIIAIYYRIKISSYKRGVEEK